MKFTPADHLVIAKATIVLYPRYGTYTTSLRRIIDVAYVLWYDAKDKGLIGEVVHCLHEQIYPPNRPGAAEQNHRDWAELRNHVQDIESGIDSIVLTLQDQKRLVSIATKIYELSQLESERLESLGVFLWMIIVQVPDARPTLQPIADTVGRRAGELKAYMQGKTPIPATEPMMQNFATLVLRLQKIVAKEGDESIMELGGRVCTEVSADPDRLYEGLREYHPRVQEIASLASDLEIGNGNERELMRMWWRIRRLVKQLSKEVERGTVAGSTGKKAQQNT